MRKPLAIALAAALSFVPLAHAQTPPLPAQTGVLSQDVSDLWWDSSQSGWGLGLFQSGTFVFATLFVYNSSNQAAWFTANLTSQGNGLYTGPLYQTTGPYYASTTFDPNQVTRSQVGTMSFAVQTNGSAILTYTVNGTTVTKTVRRQSMGLANLTGVFTVQSSVTATGCNSGNGTTIGTSRFTITNTGGNNIQIAWQNPNGGTCTYNGTQTQAGRFASLVGANYTCSTGETGTLDFSNLSSTNGIFSGQVSGGTTSSFGCSYTGGFSGLNNQSFNQQQ